MQGLIETGGSVTPANSQKGNYRRYMPTLAAFMVPAMLSGMVAAFVYADAKPRVGPMIDLVERAEMVRYAAQKVPTIAIDGTSLTATSLARTSAEHRPLDDVSRIATSQIDVATR